MNVTEKKNRTLDCLDAASQPFKVVIFEHRKAQTSSAIIQCYLLFKMLFFHADLFIVGLSLGNTTVINDSQA